VQHVGGKDQPVQLIAGEADVARERIIVGGDVGG